MKCGVMEIMIYFNLGLATTSCRGAGTRRSSDVSAGNGYRCYFETNFWRSNFSKMLRARSPEKYLKIWIVAQGSNYEIECLVAEPDNIISIVPPLLAKAHLSI